MNKEKISGTQLATLLYIMIMSTVVLYVPGITARAAKQSAWLITLIIPPIAGFYILFLASKLEKRFPGQSLIQFSESIFGKLLGKLFASLYIFFYLVTNVLVIREFGEFLKATLLQETPIMVLHMVLVFVAGYSAAKGIEVIARMSQFILPLFLFSLSILIVFSIPDLNPPRLLPLLEGGIMPIVKGSFVPTAWFGEIVVVSMLLPHLNKPRELMKKGTLALLGLAVFLTFDTLATLMVFGPEFTGYLTFPFWSLARNIELGHFVQRLESLIVALWMAGIVIKAALLYLVQYLGIIQLLKLKPEKIIFSLKTSWVVLVTLAGLQIFAATYLIKNTLNLSQILESSWPVFALVFELVLPTGFLVLAWLRKAGRKGAR